MPTSPINPLHKMIPGTAVVVDVYVCASSYRYIVCSYLIPGIPHIRGGAARNYSRLVHIKDCGNFGYRIRPAKNFTANQILILTNGFCGSTCALFSNHVWFHNPPIIDSQLSIV
jgi:hypothetical protein